MIVLKVLLNNLWKLYDVCLDVDLDDWNFRSIFRMYNNTCRIYLTSDH